MCIFLVVGFNQCLATRGQRRAKKKVMRDVQHDICIKCWTEISAVDTEQYYHHFYHVSVYKTNVFLLFLVYLVPYLLDAPLLLPFH